MPKKNRAIVSTNQILMWKSGSNSNRKELIIPTPQMRYITFLIFFFFVISPDDFVKRKNELYDNKPKKITALTLCIIALISLSIKNVPILPGNSATEQGNRHIHNPATPEQVNKISSTFVYPL
jgi:hypothetical protein